MIKSNIVTVLGSIVTIMIASTATAENRNFNFLSPSFGGNPQNGVFLFGVAQAQLTATNRNPVASGGTAGAGGGIGGGATGGDTIGGPTIIIPINTGQPQGPVVTTGATATEATVLQVI